MPVKLVVALLVTLSVLFAGTAYAAEEVNVYSARKEKLIKPLLDKFTQETGIKTNLITAKADKLLTRLVNEGRNSPADVFITVDAGRLYRAREQDVLQPLESEQIENIVPAHLRDPEGYWVGLSQRARVIFYAKDRVKPGELSSYEALAEPKWKNRICIRSSSNIYNQSLVASMIASNGIEATEQWARGLVANMARPPKGGDRDQIRAVAAGQCDIAVANTYYYGTMLSDKKDPAQMEAAQKVALFWPNQQGRGAHVNISGAGLVRHAPNRANGLKLIEFLLGKDAQQWYGEVNYEYPVRPDAAASELLQSWGDFKADNLNLSKLGSNNLEAVKIMDRAGWK